VRGAPQQPQRPPPTGQPQPPTAQPQPQQPAAAQQKKPEEPRNDRFSLIELE
jgi:hypothetical protein